MASGIAVRSSRAVRAIGAMAVGSIPLRPGGAGWIAAGATKVSYPPSTRSRIDILSSKRATKSLSAYSPSLPPTSTIPSRLLSLATFFYFHALSSSTQQQNTRPFTTRSEPEDKKNKVVVVGGGYAGIEAARGLDKAFDVALVAGGQCLRHVMYGLRASVLPEQTPRMLVPYDNLLGRGTVKTCNASKINVDECTVTLATGESLPYDYLVLATGILHPKTPGVANNASTKADAIALFKEANADLKAAQSILIIGGGPIGIEMAGEIMEEMPGKKVTLVTSKELMPSPTVAFSNKFRTRLRKKLEKVGVTVHTDVGRVNFSMEDINASGFIPGKKTYSWTGGEVEADLCIVATGATQPSSLYADSGLQAWLNEKGQVKVEDTLEVKEAPGSGKVFAIGDCMDLEVPKLGFLAGQEGKSVAKQIKASATGKPLKSGKPPVMPVSIVPVGKSGGVSSMPMGFVAGDFMTKTIKSKDVFASKVWGDLGAGKAPAV